MALKTQKLSALRYDIDFMPTFLQGRIDDVNTILQFIEKSQYDEIPKIIRHWSDLSLPSDFSCLMEWGDNLNKSAQIRNPQKCYAILDKISLFLIEKEKSFID